MLRSVIFYPTSNIVDATLYSKSPKLINLLRALIYVIPKNKRKNPPNVSTTYIDLVLSFNFIAQYVLIHFFEILVHLHEVQVSKLMGLDMTKFFINRFGPEI